MQVQFKQVIAGAALAIVSVSSAYAGGFVDVLNTGERTPGSTNNSATDPFFLTGGIPSTWTQQASVTTSVYSPINNSIQVGNFIDTVWIDATTNQLIIGSYFQLLPNYPTGNIHGGGGISEINSIVRTGFSDVDTISAAWYFADGIYSGAEGGYRLRDPSRSGYQASYNDAAAASGAYLDLDKVAIRTDVSIGEDNPNSGIYFLSVDASQYTYEFGSNAIGIIQGASTNEGGRVGQEIWLSGFRVAEVAAVPEPSEYALMLIGLGMMGFVARRRKNKELS
ncbi:PEP-CTERM sorting domain-containing protein [Methylobacillus caricis]|uniref:PEP-CTERM sorting domain-containing protein n=1 Tax=Methylobacillus caricis TaxID=1971611 RepID=UPI001CFFA1A9|nr:PEP-CTERM sorting domain-containing protein [Methylobacillus caricis]MCB5188090.1 PEP-CTERM sorting domain-containing protein [Methylobacillus caricis]